MTNGFKENGVIGEERITLEPYPGKEFLYFDNKDHYLLQNCTLGIKGTGLDGTELNGGLLAHSIKINDEEKANVYVYPLSLIKMRYKPKNSIITIILYNIIN